MEKIYYVICNPRVAELAWNPAAQKKKFEQRDIFNIPVIHLAKVKPKRESRLARLRHDAAASPATGFPLRSNKASKDESDLS